MKKTDIVTKWVPTTNLLYLRRLGKLIEELGELQAVAGRCIIQGLHEVDPTTQMMNFERLEAEVADVQAQCDCTIEALRLNKQYICDRRADKMQRMAEWEALCSDDAP